MGYDNLRLEKGMYRQAGMSFTQVLESLTPAKTTAVLHWKAPTLFSAS